MALCKGAANIVLARKVVVVAGYGDAGKEVSCQLSLITACSHRPALVHEVLQRSHSYHRD